MGTYVQSSQVPSAPMLHRATTPASPVERLQLPRASSRPKFPGCTLVQMMYLEAPGAPVLHRAVTPMSPGAMSNFELPGAAVGTPCATPKAQKMASTLTGIAPPCFSPMSPPAAPYLTRLVTPQSPMSVFELERAADSWSPSSSVGSNVVCSPAMPRTQTWAGAFCAEDALWRSNSTSSVAPSNQAQLRVVLSPSQQVSPVVKHRVLVLRRANTLPATPEQGLLDDELSIF